MCYYYCAKCRIDMEKIGRKRADCENSWTCSVFKVVAECEYCYVPCVQTQEKIK